MNTSSIAYGPSQVFDDCLPESLYQSLLIAASRIGWLLDWSTLSNPHSGNPFVRAELVFVMKPIGLTA